MKIGLLVCGLAGAALGTVLVLYFGLSQIGDAFLAVGWQGMAAMCAAHLAAQVICGFSWRVLAVEVPCHAATAFVWARWLRDSVGNILAIVPAAGELVAARELTFHGVGLGTAGATTIVDLTAEILSQLLFTLLGVSLLIGEYPGESGAWWAAVGLGVATLATGGFIAAQRKGLLEIIEAMPQRLGLGRPFEKLTQAQRINSAIKTIYDHPNRLGASVALHFAAWLAGTAEAWLALWFMGHPLDFDDILVIESLVFALRSAAFAVPWAAGIQEGGYLALGTLFGLSPEVALALALLKRAREIATGLPCLLIWQFIETRRLWTGASGRQRARAPEISEP
jgi:putative membrane protein